MKSTISRGTAVRRLTGAALVTATVSAGLVVAGAGAASAAPRSAVTSRQHHAVARVHQDPSVIAVQIGDAVSYTRGPGGKPVSRW